MLNKELSKGKSQYPNIYLTEWVPEKVKGTVVIVHGIGEHIGRYITIATALNQAGYAVFGFDLPGHGKSGGKRGYIPSDKMVLDIVSQRLEDASQCFPHASHFLYGHSLGGNLVLTYGLTHKPGLSGIISSGPPIKVFQKVPNYKLFLVKVLSGIAPSFTMDTGLDVSNLSRDPSVVLAYQSDPLVHSKGSVSFANNMFKSGQWILDHANEFPAIPILLMEGSADRIVSVEAVRIFAQKCSAQVTYKEWEGFYHEIHNEPEKEKVFQFMIDWMDEQK
jgi:alpha-beta hydrolase superfamily lysophospholipase